MALSKLQFFPTFPAKLLLFGEYTILMGSQALALPLSINQYSGQLVYTSSGNTDPSMLDWAGFLQEKATTLTMLQFDHAGLKRDLNEGLFFRSNIPFGYGLGSSGVLCAAILTHYSDKQLLDNLAKEPDQLKQVFIEMESFFHEKSSGLDPLVSFYKSAVFMPKRGEVELLASNYLDDLKGFYLIDSHQSRQTAQWVQTFNQHIKTDSFHQKMMEMAELQTTCITAFLEADSSALASNMHTLSLAQAWTMKEWIPTEMLELWLKGLDSDQFYMKLCGAGGGGYFLVYIPEHHRSEPIPGDWIEL